MSWPISGRRTVLGALGVLFAAGAFRTLAMGAVASQVGEARLGAILGAGILAGAAAGAAVLAWVVRPAPHELLALKRISAGQVMFWLAAGLALSGATDLAAWVLGRPFVLPDWVTAANSAPPGLLAVALIATSIFEELYLRGFLQGALSTTRLGPWGAIALVTLLFSLMHFPGDAFRFFDVLLSGGLLAYARHHTGSSLAAVAPHIAGNLKVLVLIAWSVGAA